MGPFLRQVWTVSGVLLNTVGQGMAIAYPSSLMPALKSADAEIPADLTTASWIASSIGVGSIPGSFLSSYFMERYGRRIAHGLVITPGILGWLLIFFASNTTILLIGRLLCGVTSGATIVLGAVIIGEYSSPANRGMFLNIKTAAFSIGGMFIHILDNFCYWRTIALISLVPYISAILIITTWPESPAWLAANGHFKESKNSFFWLRGKNEHSMKELNDMIQAQMERAKQMKELSFGETIRDFFKKFTKKNFLKPVFIILLGSLLLEVSGRHLFPAYALRIMGEITGNASQSFYFTLAIDLIITTSTTISSVIIKIMRRRQLLFGSGFAAVFVILTACTYLFLVSRGVLSKDYPWVVVGMFVIFFILANFGCTPIPLAFFGELLPLEHRGAGSALGGIIMSLALYLGLQVPPFLLQHCMVYGTFTILGVSIAVLLLILYFILPETKARTLQEIEDFFNHGKFKDDLLKDDDEEAKVKMISDVEVKLS